MDYQTAAKQIQKGQVAPVYLCYGAETFLMEEFIAFLISRIISPEQRDFALGKYDLAETSLEKIIDDAETPPFLVPRKVILAHNANFFTAAKDNGKIEHPVEALQRYLLAPADFSTVVFIVHTEKLDERKKLVKAMKEKDMIVSFAGMSADELLQWVRRRAEQAGIVLESAAAERLTAMTGGNLQSIAAEVDKIALYVGERGTVGEETILQLVAPTMEQNVFMLIEDIVRFNLHRAFSVFHELLKQKEEPVKIVLLMARQFRIVLLVKELVRQGYSHQQIAGQLGLHPYAVKMAAEQGKRLEAPRLQSILSELSDLDYRMKSGKVDKVLGVEMFLLGLAANHA